MRRVAAESKESIGSAFLSMVLLKLNNEMSNQRTLCRRFSEFALSVRRFSRDENANLGFRRVRRVGGKSQVAASGGSLEQRDAKMCLRRVFVVGEIQ